MNQTEKQGLKQKSFWSAIRITNFAVITAGGKGTRMKCDKNKSFLKLKGKEIIAHTLELFENCPEIDKIVIVINQDCRKELESIIRKYCFKKIAGIAIGGKERQDSVWNGVQKAGEFGAKEKDIILVHSSVNPLVLEATITECIEAAKSVGASVAAFPVKDTIHQVDEKSMLVKAILPRKELWAAQTPQVMQFDLAKKAFEKAYEEKWFVTDEVQLVKKVWGEVKVVNCGYENIKITTPEDISLAEKILEKRGQ